MTTPLLTTKQAAALLNIKPGTMAIWRLQGKGPRYLKISKAVRYSVNDLNEFIDQSVRASTSESITNAVSP